MAKPRRDELEAVKRLMCALVRIPPKPHEDMKIGKGTTKKERETKNFAPLERKKPKGRARPLPPPSAWLLVGRQRNPKLS